MEKLIQDQLDQLKNMQSLMTRLEEKSLAEGACATQYYFSGRRESYEEAIQILEYLLREFLLQAA